MKQAKIEKAQWEEESAEGFRQFLSNARNEPYAITGRDVPIATGENFDYQFQNQVGQKIAVELFRLVESEEGLAKERAWGKVVEILKQELLKRGVKGYLISTPELWVKTNQISALSAQLANDIEQVVKNNQTNKKFEYSGFEFKKIKNLDTIIFSHSLGVRSIDPKGTAANSFAKKLPKKNQQVNMADHERILLVVNWTTFVDATDAIRALSSFDFQYLENIDKIFFETKQGEFALIFDRSVLETVQQKQNVHQLETLQLQLLIQYLRYQLGDKSQDAFDFIKTTTSTSRDISWLTDNGAKENLVRFGEELLAKGLVDDATWIVSQLKDDPDPSPEGENDSNDPKGDFNYHLKIFRGDDVGIITTVRGHLCWLMAGLIVQNKPEYYTEIIEIIKDYIADKNLYIRIQATVPLSELVIRKKAIRNQDGSPFHWSKNEREFVRSLPFVMLRQNAQYPRVLEALLDVFDKFRDLTEKEAEEVLATFIATGEDYILHDLAPLVVYFALFREKDFTKDGPFDNKKFVPILKQQIVGGGPSMRSSLAWHFWKILQDKLLPYESTREYLYLFWQGKYDSGVASMFGLVFEELAKVAPEDAVELFQKMLLRLKNTVKTSNKKHSQFWINGTEKIIPLLAANPNALIAAVKNLKDIWMRGSIFIGDIKTIFESYRLVVPESEERVKSELSSIFEKMKKAQPNLPQIDWNK